MNRLELEESGHRTHLLREYVDDNSHNCAIEKMDIGMQDTARVKYVQG